MSGTKAGAAVSSLFTRCVRANGPAESVENAMFEPFRCQCIYVEVSNDAHPHSGCVEYRAKSCAVCQARAALMRGNARATVAFEQYAPRYQRMH